MSAGYFRRGSVNIGWSVLISTTKSPSYSDLCLKKLLEKNPGDKSLDARIKALKPLGTPEDWLPAGAAETLHRIINDTPAQHRFPPFHLNFMHGGAGGLSEDFARGSVRGRACSGRGHSGSEGSTHHKRKLVAIDVAEVITISDDDESEDNLVETVAGMGRGGGATDDDTELQAAIAESLGQASGSCRMGMGVGMGRAHGGVGGSGDDHLARALAASLAGANPTGGGGGGTKRGSSAAGVSGKNGGSGGHDADADLAAAIAASLVEGGGGSSGGGIMVLVAATAPIPEEPGPGKPGTMTLAIRVPSGARLQRRFRSSDTVGGEEAFVAAAAETDMSRHVLTTAFPRKQLREPRATLKDAGITDKEALSVEPTNAQ